MGLVIHFDRNSPMTGGGQHGGTAVLRQYGRTDVAKVRFCSTTPRIVYVFEADLDIITSVSASTDTSSHSRL